VPKRNSRRAAAKERAAKRARGAELQARSLTVNRRSDPPGVVRVDGPEARLGVFFEVLDDLISTSIGLAATTDLTVADEQRVVLAALNRAVNILEASRVLLAGAHWEAASSQARQLFELLVNLEHISQQPDPQAARFKYAKYGLMQFAERTRRNLDYERATGRAVDEELAQQVAQVLASPDFDEFKDSKGKWLKSWSGRTTRRLAELSPSEMRLKQYEMLFSEWSEETHAAPGALIGAIVGRQETDWVERAVAEDDREIGQLILLLVVLFLETTRTLEGVPTPDLEHQLMWMARLDAELRSRGLRPAEPLVADSGDGQDAD